MRLSKDITEKLVELVTPVVEELDLELVDIKMRQEHNNNILDITIDKESGVTIDDCSRVSEKLSLLLDVEEIIQYKYHLQVGSPGIFRELKTERDFFRSIDKRVKAVFKDPRKGSKKIIGVLKSFENRVVTIQNERNEISAELGKIKRIQLFPEL